jgi:hypothetical protein
MDIGVRSQHSPRVALLADGVVTAHGSSVRLVVASLSDANSLLFSLHPNAIRAIVHDATAEYLTVTVDVTVHTEYDTDSPMYGHVAVVVAVAVLDLMLPCVTTQGRHWDKSHPKGCRVCPLDCKASLFARHAPPRAAGITATAALIVVYRPPALVPDSRAVAVRCCNPCSNCRNCCCLAHNRRITTGRMCS